MQKILINSLLYINKKFFFKREHPFNISKNGVLDLNYADFEYKHSKNLLSMYTDYIDLDKFNNAKVLDIGCGAGGKALYLTKHYNSTVVGIDLNEIFLKEANEFALEKGYRDKLSFKKEDATNMSFGDNSFDIIIMSDVLEHIPNTAIMLDEAYRVLKKGGTIIFDFAPYYHFFGHHIWDTIQIPWLHVFTTENFRISLYEESVKKYPDGDKRIDLRIGKVDNKREFSYLNKITRKKFETIIEDFNDKYIIHKNIKYSMLKNINFLGKMPFFRELFIKHIIGVIIKK